MLKKSCLIFLLFSLVHINAFSGGMTDDEYFESRLSRLEIKRKNDLSELSVDDYCAEYWDNDRCPYRSLDDILKIAEFRDNYEEMKEIETSFENRMLGATGIASMGIGGMQLASAMSEEKADAAAEQQMKAYLATFSCTYADGKRFKGGESAIELPGGNDLIGLYSEYVNLANDLKTRKQALGLRAGIEAEPILDSATSGLYDDVATGKTSGAFASLARALSDPNGEDAAAWAAQKEATAQKKKTGLAVAGIGAVASIAGNLLVNRDVSKNKKAKVKEEYSEVLPLLKRLKEDLAKTEKPTCKSLGAEGEYPDCFCSAEDEVYNGNAAACEKKSVDMSESDVSKLFKPLIATPVFNNETKCLESQYLENGECIPCETGYASVENNTGGIDSCVRTCYVLCSGEETCPDGYDCTYDKEWKSYGVQLQTEECSAIPDKCPIITKQEKIVETPSQELVAVETETQVLEDVNSTDTLLDTFYADDIFLKGLEISKPVYSKLQTAAKELEESAKERGSDYCFVIKGYADRTGDETKNKSYSKQRAEKLKNILFPFSTVSVVGLGEEFCTKESYPNDNEPECRKMEVHTCDLTEQNVGASSGIGQVAGYSPLSEGTEVGTSYFSCSPVKITYENSDNPQCTKLNNYQRVFERGVQIKNIDDIKEILGDSLLTDEDLHVFFKGMNLLMAVEGYHDGLKCSEDPKDRGGLTCYGIAFYYQWDNMKRIFGNDKRFLNAFPENTWPSIDDEVKKVKAAREKSANCTGDDCNFSKEVRVAAENFFELRDAMRIAYDTFYKNTKLYLLPEYLRIGVFVTGYLTGAGTVVKILDKTLDDEVINICKFSAATKVNENMLKKIKDYPKEKNLRIDFYNNVKDYFALCKDHAYLIGWMNRFVETFHNDCYSYTPLDSEVAVESAVLQCSAE